MTSIMSWEQHHSKPITKIGRGTQWSKTSRNGLPSLSVRSDFPRRKALTDTFIGVQPCNNGTGEDSKKDVKQCVKLPMDQEGFCYVTAGTFTRRGLSSTAKTLRSLSGVRGSEY